jgi:hypothetical protein
MAAAGGDKEFKAIQSTSVAGKKGGERDREYEREKKKKEKRKKQFF